MATNWVLVNTFVPPTSATETGNLSGIQAGDLLIGYAGKKRASSAPTGGTFTDSGTTAWTAHPASPLSPGVDAIAIAGYKIVASSADAAGINGNPVNADFVGGSGTNSLQQIEVDQWRATGGTIIGPDLNLGHSSTANQTGALSPASGSSRPLFTDELATAGLYTPTSTGFGVALTGGFSGTASGSYLVASTTYQNQLTSQYVGDVQASAVAATNTFGSAWTAGNSVAFAVFNWTFYYAAGITQYPGIAEVVVSALAPPFPDSVYFCGLWGGTNTEENPPGVGFPALVPSMGAAGGYGVVGQIDQENGWGLILLKSAVVFGNGQNSEFQLGPGSVVITNVSAAAAAEVTTQAPHNLVTGQEIVISQVTGTMASTINPSDGGYWTVTVVDATHFTVAANTTGLTYTGGGVIAYDTPVNTSLGNGLPTGIVQVDGGDQWGCAVNRDGTVWAWGYNGTGTGVTCVGNMGNNNTVIGGVTPANKVWAVGATAPTPTYLAAATTLPANGQKIIAAGASHGICLTPTGGVVAWGDDAVGQCGQGGPISGTAFHPVPVQVVAGAGPADGSGNLTDIVAVDAGNLQSVALDSSGNVWTWGGNQHGQLGNGAALPGANQSAPVAVAFNQSVTPVTLPIVAISAGGNLSSDGHTLLLDSAGVIWAAGNNVYGQLGNGNGGSGQSVSTFNPVIKDGSNLLASAIGAGGQHSGAIATGGAVTVAPGQLYTWGNNLYGQLGNGNALPDTGNYFSPKALAADFAETVTISKFSAGSESTMIVTTAAGSSSGAIGFSAMAGVTVAALAPVSSSVVATPATAGVTVQAFPPTGSAPASNTGFGPPGSGFNNGGGFGGVSGGGDYG